MNTKPLTLTEVSKLLDELPVEEAMENEQALQFIDIVEKAGKEILAQRGAGDYCENASAFLLASSVAELLESDDPKCGLIAMAIMQNVEIFQLILGYAFIYSVGLCAVEELR